MSCFETRLAPPGLRVQVAATLFLQDSDIDMAGPDLSRLSPGLRGEARTAVSQANTARQLGSGTLDCFATPALIALMEAAAVDCVEHLLPEGTTSLGTRIETTHEAPTAPGRTVFATAILDAIEGRALHFQIAARDEAGPIGSGRHTRVVVETQRFLARMAARAAPDEGQS